MRLGRFICQSLVFCGLFLAFSAPLFAQELPRIAVYVTGDVPDNEKRALGTRMLASLVNSGRYRGIERSNAFLAEIEREQVRQRSGAIDDSQISALGRQFGIKYVCIADITPAFGTFQVSARIVDVETAEVVYIGESHSPLQTMDDLALVSNEVVRAMFSRAGEAAPVVQSRQDTATPATAAIEPTTSRTNQIVSHFHFSDFRLLASMTESGMTLTEWFQKQIEIAAANLIGSELYSTPAEESIIAFGQQFQHETLGGGRIKLLNDRDICRIALDNDIPFIAVFNVNRGNRNRGNDIDARILDTRNCKVVNTAQHSGFTRNSDEILTTMNVLWTKLLNPQQRERRGIRMSVGIRASGGISLGKREVVLSSQNNWGMYSETVSGDFYGLGYEIGVITSTRLSERIALNLGLNINQRLLVSDIFHRGEDYEVLIEELALSVPLLLQLRAGTGYFEFGPQAYITLSSSLSSSLTVELTDDPSLYWGFVILGKQFFTPNLSIDATLVLSDHGGFGFRGQFGFTYYVHRAR